MSSNTWETEEPNIPRSRYLEQLVFPIQNGASLSLNTKEIRKELGMKFPSFKEAYNKVNTEINEQYMYD